MGSNGDPGGSKGSLAGRGDDEKSDRPLNPLETKTIRAELRRWRNSEGQTRRNQLDTAKRIQKWIFTCGDRVPLSYAGGPWAVLLPERLAAPGGMLRTLGRALMSPRPTHSSEKLLKSLLRRPFSCHWVPLSSFPFPQTLCSRPCLAWTHPPFHAYCISCLKSGDPTMSKVGGVITWRCMRRRFFLLNISNVLLCDYRRACRAPVTRLADKMAPG